jgi:hypothetical protein
MNMTITGGEPFLDNKNFPRMLRYLSEDVRFKLRIYTNGFWKPDLYGDIDKSRIYLTSSFHSSQTSFEDYRRRILGIRDAGFQFATLIIVLAPENLDNAEHALTTLESDGFPVTGSAMQPAGQYMDRTERTAAERKLLREFGNPFSLFHVAMSPITEGRACFHPAFSYRLHPDGTVNVACVGKRQNIFTDGIPVLPRHAVACPVQYCEGCPEMIRAMVNVPHYDRPLSVYHPDEALQENMELREARRNGLNPGKSNLFDLVEAHWDRNARPGKTFVPLSQLKSPGGDLPFGYIDKIEGSDVIQALSRDRVYLSGWAGSSKVGERIREVNLYLGEKKLASVTTFYPRPEVVIAFHRPDLLETGWRALFYLPILGKGEYQLIARAVTESGATGNLPPFTVRIRD